MVFFLFSDFGTGFVGWRRTGIVKLIIGKIDVHVGSGDQVFEEYWVD